MDDRTIADDFKLLHSVTSSSSASNHRIGGGYWRSKSIIYISLRLGQNDHFNQKRKGGRRLHAMCATRSLETVP